MNTDDETYNTTMDRINSITLLIKKPSHKKSDNQIKSAHYKNIGRLYEKLKKIKSNNAQIEQINTQIETHYQKAIELDPDNPRNACCYWFLAYTLKQAGSHQEAIEYYKKALEFYKNLKDKENQLKCYHQLSVMYHSYHSLSMPIKTLNYDIAGARDGDTSSQLRSFHTLINFKNIQSALGYCPRQYQGVYQKRLDERRTDTPGSGCNI